MYFKGFHKMRDQWNEDAWETKCSEIFSQAIDECIADAIEMAEYFPRKFRKSIMNEIREDLVELDKTLRFLKSEGLHTDDIEYVMLDTADYYSDRHINKFSWLDEPTKELVTKYPIVEKSGLKGFKRARARQDPWVTMSFFIEI
jgi:hypothetical protein